MESEPTAENQTEQVQGTGEQFRGMVFFKCPGCDRDDFHCVCPNCGGDDKFKLEGQQGARCDCESLISWINCQCGTRVAPKFFHLDPIKQLALIKTRKESAQQGPSWVLTIGGGFILLCVLALFGKKCCYDSFCQGSEDDLPQQKISAPAEPTPEPVSKPKPSLDCKALLVDADLLERTYGKVRAKRYRVTEKNCESHTKTVNNRINMTWHQRRGVTPLAEKGESKVMSAARTMGVSVVEIVLSFACDGAKKLRRQHGREVIVAYERDFKKYLGQLREECKGAAGP